MIDELFETYTKCQRDSLITPEFPLDSGAPQDKRLLWEKTVELLYTNGIQKEAKFVAPLAGAAERYGDLLLAFNTLKWVLIEFKKESANRKSEKDKYVYADSNKYDNKRDQKSAAEIQSEMDMFAAFVKAIALRQEDGKREGLGNEPHFFIFSPAPLKKLKSSDDLCAQRYWGTWANGDATLGDEKLVDVAVPVQDIPQLGAEYKQFVKYASCINLAKGGGFAFADDDGGGGGRLVDISLVIGLTEGKRIGHVNTLENFLHTHKQMLQAQAVPTLAGKPRKGLTP